MSDDLQVISMEDFGPIAVDWFNEYRVKDVVDGKKLKLTKGTEHVPVWAIEFENGGLILNYDPTVPMPKVKGAAQTMVVMSSSGTQLRFGLEPVNLNALEYALWHPTLTRGMLVFAQRSRYNMPTAIPEHDDARAAEAPEVKEDDGA